MAEDYVGQQDLDPIYPDRTLDFEFTFLDVNGDPIDVSGKTLWFTALIDNTDDIPGDNDIQVSKLFPDDADSQNGIGSMELTKEDTAVLIPGRNMYYDFTLVDGDRKDPMGAGRFEVLQHSTKTLP